MQNHPLHGKRVLLTAESSGYGGIERRFIEDIRVLKSLGATPVLAPARFRGVNKWLDDARQAGATVIDWRPYKFIERRQFQFPFPQIAALRRSAVTRGAFDLAHVALSWTTVGLTRAHELAVAGIPTVLSLRCDYPKQSLAPAALPFIRKALEPVLGAYAVSDIARRSFLANYAEYTQFPIEVIHNGVDTQRFKPDPEARSAIRQQLGIGADTALVVWVGRLDAMKNPQLALAAFAALLSKGRKCHLLLVGDGPLASVVREGVQTGKLATSVTLTGQVADVERYLAAGDVYLATSCSEGFPSSPAEAYSCGLPLVLSDIEAFTAVYANIRTTRFCARNDADQFAEAMALQLDRDKATGANADLGLFDAHTMRSSLAAFYMNYTQPHRPVPPTASN